MEREWKLGKDMYPEDNLLDGLTFNDLILAVHQCKTVNKAAVQRNPERDHGPAVPGHDIPPGEQHGHYHREGPGGEGAGMNFDQLCKDFSERKPKGPMTCRVPFFKVKWEDGRKSANDLLRDFPPHSRLRIHQHPRRNCLVPSLRALGDAANMRLMEMMCSFTCATSSTTETGGD